MQFVGGREVVCAQQRRGILDMHVWEYWERSRWKMVASHCGVNRKQTGFS